MIMELLSTISIITHNGLNGLFVPPWQRRLVKHAMLPCKQAQLVRCIHGSVRSGASLRKNVPTAHPILTQVLNRENVQFSATEALQAASFHQILFTEKVRSPQKQNFFLWLVALHVKVFAFFSISWYLFTNHDPVPQDNPQSRLWASSCRNHLLSTKLNCITALKETCSYSWTCGLWG